MTTSNNSANPLIGVVMGSSSDWETMQHAVQILTQFGVAHEAQVVSAHRMPDELFAYAEKMEPGDEQKSFFKNRKLMKEFKSKLKASPYASDFIKSLVSTKDDVRS